jgi:hypothetical protein
VRRHAGSSDTDLRAAHRSPYPVQRLSAPIDLVDVAREIEAADALLAGTTNARLEELAIQIRTLQERAHVIMEEARLDAALHRARCSFHRRVGHTYFLYRRGEDELYFSMLSPSEWRRPPHPFIGAFRLEPDMRWSAVSGAEKPRSLLDRVPTD